MLKTSLNTKDILQKQFKHSFRGFNIEEVDQFLDIVIRDYDAFQKEITFLQAENERLVAKVDELSRQAKVSKTTRTTGIPTTGVTNFDILKRLSNLEKHVFDSKLAPESREQADTPISPTSNDSLGETRVIKPLS
ncbi:DivIVA domain-containing protein [Granulicatella balaenopterae]|uniref:DivIVA domain-containing protein n=1 Tax=Granulicatella balaenopterae TaxID=137733 RepID=A0A1H9P174_9LACT|nr:cell division regulator GpsB [Granulicatella balaenopterae]SER41986.1 DivIVA domain-containing protein [Granulicatella balaenopterae]